jgi:hypothetical protein
MTHTHTKSTAQLVKLCGYRMDECETLFNSCQDQTLFLLQNVQTTSGAHTAPCISMGIFLSSLSPSRLWRCAHSQAFTIHKNIWLATHFSAHISDDYPYLKVSSLTFHMPWDHLHVITGIQTIQSHWLVFLNYTQLMDVSHNVTDIGWDKSEHFSPGFFFHSLTTLPCCP